MIYYNRATEEYEEGIAGEGSMGRSDIEGSENLSLEIINENQSNIGMIAYIEDIRQKSDYWAINYEIFKDKVIVYEETDMGESSGTEFKNLEDAIKTANEWC